MLDLNIHLQPSTRLCSKKGGNIQFPVLYQHNCLSLNSGAGAIVLGNAVFKKKGKKKKKKNVMVHFLCATMM